MEELTRLWIESTVLAAGPEQDGTNVVKKYGDVDRSRGVEKILAMPVEGEDDCCIVVGRKNGTVDVLEGQTGAVVATFECDRGRNTISQHARVRGMAILQEHQKILVCSRGGGVAVHTTKDSWDRDSGFELKGPVDCAQVDRTHTRLAYGGEGRELSVVDLERQGKEPWRAKQPEPNKVGVRPRAWLSAVDFVGRGPDLVLVGTADHEVRLYDTRAQKGHVVALPFGESRVTNIASQPDGSVAWLANAMGTVQKLDMRKHLLEATLRGPCASIRSLCHHPERMLLASAGLDRFCRIHDTVSRKTLYKSYLKNQLTAVCFLPEQDTKPVEEEGDRAPTKALHGRSNPSTDPSARPPAKKKKKGKGH